MVVGAIEKDEKAFLDGAKKVSSKLQKGVSFVASKTKSLVNKVGDLWNKGKTTVKNVFIQADKEFKHAVKSLLKYEWIPGRHAFSVVGGGKIGGSHSLKDAYQFMKGRLPRTDGKWVGEPGNGKWYSHKEPVKKVTGGKPVEFKNDRPNCIPWSKGTIKFKPGQLNGTRKDFDLVYAKIRKIKGLKSNNVAKEWLR
ncbi:hypothetical protein [Bacillus sp. XF8]|uniref:hypothetical protein n=1 Tax=Bacillus sp. XF8 TaxID=2819289 RepID=UPI001AA07C06|nr:hypothetical protein [Bacillus sp. XF8]MBO1580123.1 hypothetical protein [Bacillus sp. XF8]